MEDLDKTMPGRRYDAASDAAADATMPGKRDRKPDGRFAVGDLIMNRYKVLAELGQGGMGVVYKCFDETAGIEVALKALPPELSHNTLEMEDIKENFQLVHNLHHPNIASSNTLELDRSNGNYYLIMECVEGEDLRRWLKRKRKEGPLTLDLVLPIIRQVAAALDYAHKEMIIHRDIKPGNIMINSAGDVKVLDFGLAAQIHTSMTRVSMAYHGTSGTGPYMAPEQWRGQAQGAAADQYALAVMTYEMLAGHLPFESTDVAVLQQAVLTQEAATLAGIPHGVNRAIERAMSKEAADRFSSCSDFADALAGKKFSTPVKRSGRRPLLLGIAVVFILLLAAGGYAFFRQYQNQQAEKAAAEAKRLVDEKATKEAEEKRLAEEKAKKEAEAKRFADEKAKQEAEAKRLADEKAKQEAEAKRLAEELARKQQDIYRLQYTVRQKKDALDAAKPDAGQTFDQYLKALSENYEVGCLAADRRDTGLAYDYFTKALKAAEWLEKNLPLREEAAELRRRVAPKKSAAERYDGAKLAYVAFQQGEKREETGNQDFEAGRFEPAALAFKAAAAAYGKAAQEAKELKHQGVLSAAQAAEKRGDWEKLQKIAGELQEYDATRAAEFRKTAESHLMPSFNLLAQIDGKTVVASLETLKTALPGGNWPKQLESGREYAFRLTHKAEDGVEYTGETAFTCDWKGPREIKVPLKKVVFTGTVVLPGEAKLKLLRVKAGTFTMGSPSTEDKRSEDEKPHQVRLTRDYWLGETEVTQAQWQAVMGNNPSNFKGGNLPVEQVSWEEAMAFCRKLNELTAGKRPAGYVYGLPTEAQWEYACRAGTTTAFSYGDASDADMMNHDGNYPCGGGRKGKYMERTTPVKSYRPNAWGFYDMHGNVWEWCADWYGSYGGDAEDPAGPSSGSYRVYRGGSWYYCAGSCRSAYRYIIDPGYRNCRLGFRLALVPGQ